MTGPGGEEVGRVTVRVSPDSSKFANELRDDLRRVERDLNITIPVDFDVDTAGLRTQIEAIRVPTVHVPVDFDDEQVDRALAAIRDREVRVGVDGDFLDREFRQVVEGISAEARVTIDKGHFDRAVKALRVPPVKVEVDVDQDRLRRSLAGVGDALRSGVGSAVGGLGSLFSHLGDVGSATAGAIATAFAGVGRALGAAGAAAGALVGLPAIAGAIAAGGAAITAAWGGVSTAIAAVPAAIGLLAAPFAAVKLGMDGIKKAAQTIKPEFDKLKESVSATFERGLTPILRTIADQVFPALQVGLNGIAQSLVGVAGRVTEFITTSAGLTAIQILFTNVKAAIDGIDLVPLLDGFLRLAGNKAALDALVGTIEEIGRGIQSIADNPALDGAFAGLEQVLASLTRAFTNLVNNGITLFKNAAPGIKEAIDAITGFFDKFDWAALGTSVGQVFSGIASAIKQIPPATVQAIQKAFQDLGATFADPGFQQGLAGFADTLPVAVRGVNDLAKGLSTLGKIFGPFARYLNETDTGVQDLSRSLAQDMVKSGQMSEEAFQRLYGSAQTNLDPLPGQVEGTVGQVPGAVEKGLAGVGPAAETGMGGVASGIQVGLQPVPGLVNQAFTNIGPLINEAMSGLASYVSFGMVELGNAVETGITTNLAPRFQAGMATLGPIVTTALTTLATTAVPPGMTALATAFTTGFATLTAQIPTMFTTPFQTALTAAFTTITAQVPATFTTPFQTALTTAFTTITGQIPTIFTLPFQTAFTTAFAAIFAQFPTIFTLPFQTAFTTAVTTLTAQFPTIFTLPLQTAFTTAFTAIAAQIPTLFAPIKTAFTTAFTEIVALVPANLETPLITAATTAMTNFTTAIRDGMTNVVTEVRTGVDAVITEIDRLPPAGTTTGDNLITSMADAILAGRSRLVNAITTVIQAAIAAAVAALQIGSPSRLSAYWGDMTIAGFVNSVRAGKGALVSSIEDTLGAGIAAWDAGTAAFSLPSWDAELGNLSSKVSAAATVAPAQAPPLYVQVELDGQPVTARARAVVGEYDQRLRGALAVRGGR